MAPVEHFRTDRLVARDWDPADAAAAFAIYGRDDVMRWLGPQPRRAVASVAEMADRIEVMAERAAARPEFGLWPLELRSSGDVIGAALLQPLPDGDVVEIGWHLNPDYWGYGYATEAGAGAITLGFSRPGLDRVVAVVDPDNVRSLAVCRRLGMTHLGQTCEYFGLTMELFELRREDPARAAVTMSRSTERGR
jgi:RimJ/RimL family protein N-acetyltransferase